MKLDWVFGKRSVSESQAQQSFSRRSFVLGGAQFGVGVMLAGRMTWLSVFENKRYTLQAESNRVNLSLIPPRRGWIVDRAGKPLALNRVAGPCRPRPSREPVAPSKDPVPFRVPARSKAPGLSRVPARCKAQVHCRARARSKAPARCRRRVL